MRNGEDICCGGTDMECVKFSCKNINPPLVHQDFHATNLSLLLLGDNRAYAVLLRHGHTGDFPSMSTCRIQLG